MQTWQLQEAKNRLSEVVDKALNQGPQVITRRGAETAVVLSMDDYRRLRQPEIDLVDFFQASPLAGRRRCQFVCQRAVPGPVRGRDNPRCRGSRRKWSGFHEGR